MSANRHHHATINPASDVWKGRPANGYSMSKCLLYIYCTNGISALPLCIAEELAIHTYNTFLKDRAKDILIFYSISSDLC